MITKYKRKGQIIPRSLISIYPKKNRHTAKFGCAVKIEGKKITALEPGCIIEVLRGYTQKKNAGSPRSYSSVTIENLNIIGFVEISPASHMSGAFNFR